MPNGLLRQHEALLHGEQHELRRLVDAERAHQVRAVHRDGVHAEVEHHGDLLVRLAVRDELQDLLLALRQPVVRVVRSFERAGLDRADEDARELGAEVLLAGRDRADRARQVGLDRVLQDVALHARVERVPHVLLVGVHAEDQDAARGPLLQHLDRRVQPVHLRHGHVHDDDVGFELLDERDALEAVAGLADHRDVGVVFEDAPEPLPHQRVVVDEDDADRLRAGVFSQCVPPLRARPACRSRAPPSAGAPDATIDPAGGCRRERELAAHQLGALAHADEPDTLATRSLRSASGGRPRPRSSISSSIRSSTCRRRTHASADPECRLTLVSASWTIR